MAGLIDDLFNLPETFPTMDEIPSSFVYLMGCGNYQQFCCTLRSLIDPGKYCPFCEPELVRRGRRPLRRLDAWQLLENEFQNPNAAHMLLITPIKHRTDAGGLMSSDWVEIGRLFEYCRSVLGIVSGGIAFRFGDPHLHAGTVAHLHFNVVEPICGNQYRVPFAKKIDDHMNNYDRLLGFRSELRARGGGEWLFSEVGIKETQPVM